MDSPRVSAFVLAVAVLLSGCTFGAGDGGPAAPTAPGTPTPGGEAVSLENSSLDLDADAVFARVEVLVGEDVQAPPVQVLQGSGAGGGAFSYPYTPYGFVEDVALTETGPGGTSAAGVTDAYGNVYLVPSAGDHEELVQLLVHEYVHAVQFRADLLPWDNRDFLGDLSTDAAQTRRALIEGAAVWVTDEYTERHQPNVTSQSDRMARLYRNASVGDRYFLARYHFGYRGVDRRIDSPDQLRGLYATDVPNTTEQLVHGYSPAEEPPRRFDVEAGDGAGWTAVDHEDEDVLGELFVRVVLSKELALDASADAAAGWGYDRLVEYERDGEPAYAWLTRWDDADEAAEFERAFETYADRRSTPANLSFRVQRAAPEYVVVYSGDPAFVGAANATVTSDGVRVAVGG